MLSPLATHEKRPEPGILRFSRFFCSPNGGVSQPIRYGLEKAVTGNSETDFDALIRDARRGRQEALGNVFEKYRNYLRLLADLHPPWKDKNKHCSHKKEQLRLRNPPRPFFTVSEEGLKLIG